MRHSVSQHLEWLRVLGNTPEYQIEVDEAVYRPALNIHHLVELLQIPISNASDASESTDKGKKRANPPSCDPGRSKKRAKTSTPNDDPHSLQEFTWAQMVYPAVYPEFPEVSVENIPVLTHTFEINYTKSIPADHMPGHFADDDSYPEWGLEEQNLEQRLAILGDITSEAREFDLGAVGFDEHSGRIVVVSEALHKRDNTTQWLCLLPSLLDDVDSESLGLTQTPNPNILVTCLELQSSHRVVLSGRLTIVLSPAVEHLPFALKVDITVALTPAIFSEPLQTGHKWVGIENAQRRLLQYLYPDPVLVPHPDYVTNIPFFYSILGPAPDLQHPDADRAMQPEDLLATLLPFQRRSVAWLLDREGKSVTPNGEIVDEPVDGGRFSFWARIEEEKQVFYLHRISGNLTLEVPDEPVPLGAILAEEPGLGKTLEVISLLLLNPPSPDRHPGIKRWDPATDVEVKAVKTTLIVTPPALANQWIDELQLHAPSLKVLLYEGWNAEKERVKPSRAGSKKKGKPKAGKKGKGKKRYDSSSDEEDDSLHEDETIEEILDWCSYVQQFDVAIVTYSTLRTDVNVARAPPKRPRREDVVYSNVERPRSPLILVEWNRVVMDEVQAVGGGAVEDMVSMIPRLASFAVSGTPARTQVADLRHVLKFLRVDHFVGSPRLWTRLISPGYSGHFTTFFRNLAIRTTKASVKAELTIPQQTRFLVGVEMGPVERHVYDQNWETSLLELGMDARGVDVRGETREPDGTLLRTVIRKLRAICTHPQIGQLGHRVFKHRSNALKTMDQVLDSMRSENWGLIIEDCRSKVQGLIRIAQLQQQGSDKNRYQHSLETLLLAEKETTQLIEEIQASIATHEANAPRRPEESESTGKGKERQRSLSPLSDLSDNNEEDGNSETSEVKEHRTRRQAFKLRLREIQLVMHRVKFLQGDLHHTLGESHSAAENAAYDEADSIRRAVLKTSEQEADKAMAALATDATSKGLSSQELLIEVPFIQYEFKDESLQEEANEIIENVLNPQAALLFGWRSRLTDLLTKRLTRSGDDEADGQEYQTSLDDQGEAELYLMNYASLLADRREALLKERTLLAVHAAREKKSRKTNAAIKAAADAEIPAEILNGDIELQPEHEVLFKELSLQRKSLLHALDGRAVKSVHVDMATRAAKMHREDDPEKIALKAAAADLRRLISDQVNLLDKLESDLALFRKAFNQRITYFRQLQEISDAVADVVFETTVAEALQESATEQRELSAKINTNRARQRYLDHLAKQTTAGEVDEEEQACILCKCDFVRGFITQCAHVFCEDCMKLWIRDKTRSTCPVCRVSIDLDKLERFTVALAEQAPAQPIADVHEHEVPKSRRKIEYSMIDPEVYREIQKLPAFGDYGNKIQTLVRHLLYIRNVDMGAQSIVFSAWADSLFIVERALRANGISCLRIDQNRKKETAVKKFEKEGIDVLLLHGERENAGLNITCASRVFLLESVVHHAFEIQAIARIDRMGQTRPTEVYCYYAEDTIEKNILDLAARHGTSIYTKNNAVGSILNGTSLTGEGEKGIDSPSKKKIQKGDFIFKINDMMAILFPHLFEDIEYLIPEEEMVDVVMNEPETSYPVNAVAGPSRLR